jgi:hypothetical protein
LAIAQTIIHHRSFLAFSKDVRANHAEDMVVWEKQVMAWERDHDAYCPYDVPDQSTCLVFTMISV